MKKILFGILFFLFMITGYSVTAEAKIVADQEMNKSVVFYFWDTWASSGVASGLGSGGFYLTFLKLIDSNNGVKYWMRVDSSRKDSILQPGKIVIGDKEYNIEAVDNPSSLQLRSGISNRSMPNGPNVNIHAFYNLTQVMIDALGGANSSGTIVLNLQTQRDVSLSLRERDSVEFVTLSMLKKEDYLDFKRK